MIESGVKEKLALAIQKLVRGISEKENEGVPEHLRGLDRASVEFRIGMLEHKHSTETQEKLHEIESRITAL